MTEQWLPIVGFEDLYEISNQGRVRTKPRLLSPFAIDAKGHLGVSLGRKCRKPIAHLVLEAFVGPRPAGLLGCHENDIPGDNRLENLRWDTYSGNNRDIVRNGNHNQASKTHCKYGHPFDDENTLIVDGGRQCRECVRRRGREGQRRYRERQRAR